MVAFYILLTFISIAHAFPKSSRPTPTHYFIFGDKFSGVNYLSKILNNTTPALPLQECRGIDLKSGSIHFDQEKETSWRYGFFSFNDLKKNLDCDIDRTLFILSVRDVRSMMCSVAKRKFQTSVEKLQSMHINGLIIHRWEDNDNLELNGSANANYKVYNYLRMRTHKLQTHYSILSRVPYGTIVRYEDVLNDPNTEIKNILRGRGLVIGSIEAPKNVLEKHNTTEACFKAFTPTLMSKAIKKLNKSIESKIGYSLVDNPLVQHTSQSQMAWNFLMNLLWWIVVPTMIILAIFGIYLTWTKLSHQYELYSRRYYKNKWMNTKRA